MALDQMPDTLTSLSTCAVAHNTARDGLGGGIWAPDANLEVDATLLEANQVLTGSGAVLQARLRKILPRRPRPSSRQS